jgi:serine protease Do
MLVTLKSTRCRILLCLMLAWTVLCLNAAQAATNNRRSQIVEAVEQASPSVVNIHGRKTVRGEGLAPGQEAGKQVNGMGTGIILDPRGYIITNHHVIDGVSNIQVTLADQQSFVARIVAHDPKTDLAIIKIDADRPLPVIRLGTSCDLMRGESVIAVGNAFGYEHTVTRGIISALHRTVQVSDDQKYQDLIQTDASINPGNSGGPLLNIDGQTIGINVAVRVGAQGIGFAIPIDEAMEVAARMLSVERLEGVSHGVEGRTISNPEAASFTVKQIRPDSAAAKAGLEAGDLIVRVGNTVVQRGLDFELGLLGRKSGQDVMVEIKRGGEVKQISMTLAEASFARSEVTDRVWEKLGLKLSPVNEQEFKAMNTRYRGGLRVLNVRPDGPAAAQGIRKGDVLVGMHIWETISLDNIAYVLDRDDFKDLQPVRFYIRRGSETLYGHMSVNHGHSTASNATLPKTK